MYHTVARFSNPSNMSDNTKKIGMRVELHIVPTCPTPHIHGIGGAYAACPPPAQPASWPSLPVLPALHYALLFLLQNRILSSFYPWPMPVVCVTSSQLSPQILVPPSPPHVPRRPPPTVQEAHLALKGSCCHYYWSCYWAQCCWVR